jgi:thiosulfate reductase cytochrome b subunit
MTRTVKILVRLPLFLSCLLIFQSTFIRSAYGDSSVTLKVYLSQVIPVVDGEIQRDEWADVPLYKDSISRSSVAFKHDGRAMYILAIYEDNSPSPQDYYGFEFDQDADAEHMGSADRPDYSILVSPSFPDSNAREAILPGPAKPIFLSELGLKDIVQSKMKHEEGRYVLELTRPFAHEDKERLQFHINQSVGIGFATGEFGKGTAHRATDMASYTLLIVNETHEGPATASSLDIYSLGLIYGPIFQYSAVVLIVVHVFRRKVWRMSKAEESFRMVRHSLSARVGHWLRVSLLMLFILSGWSLLAGIPIFGSDTSLLHVAAGFAVLLVELPIHVFAMMRNQEYRHLLIPRWDDVKVTLTIMKNFVGLTSIHPPHAVYDPSTGGYYMDRKYCSLQKLLTLGYILLLGVLGLTGFAMWYPNTFASLFALLSGGVNVRGLHLLFFYAFTAVFTAHAYLSIIPSNWERLKAMVNGSCAISVYSERQAHLPAASRNKAYCG